MERYLEMHGVIGSRVKLGYVHVLVHVHFGRRGDGPSMCGEGLSYVSDSDEYDECIAANCPCYVLILATQTRWSDSLGIPSRFAYRRGRTTLGIIRRTPTELKVYSYFRPPIRSRVHTISDYALDSFYSPHGPHIYRLVPLSLRGPRAI